MPPRPIQRTPARGVGTRTQQDKVKWTGWPGLVAAAVVIGVVLFGVATTRSARANDTPESILTSLVLSERLNGSAVRSFESYRGDAKAVQAMQEILENDGYCKQWASAVVAVGLIGGADAVQELQRIIEGAGKWGRKTDRCAAYARVQAPISLGYAIQTSPGKQADAAIERAQTVLQSVLFGTVEYQGTVRPIVDLRKQAAAGLAVSGHARSLEILQRAQADFPNDRPLQDTIRTALVEHEKATAGLAAYYRVPAK